MRLTYNELSIMDVLWRAGRPLLSTEIVEMCTNKEWKPSSIHILLNSLLDKGIIEIGGFVKTGKHYSRTFIPVISHEVFITDIITSAKLSEAVIRGIITKLISSSGLSEESLNIIEECLKAAKNHE